MSVEEARVALLEAERDLYEELSKPDLYCPLRWHVPALVRGDEYLAGAFESREEAEAFARTHNRGEVRDVPHLAHPNI